MSEANVTITEEPDPMKTIHFNTGCQYTAQGQQITATLHDDNVVTFWDRSRGIDGQFTIKNPQLFCQAVIVGKYLRNEIESTQRSRADSRDCNAGYDGE
jgi:hypothetical protein